MVKRSFSVTKPFEDEDYKDMDESNGRKNIHSVSPFLAAIVLSAIIALFGVTFAIDDILPTMLTIKDEEENKEAFIGERSRVDLKALTDLGPRVAGTQANEVEAVNYIKSQIEAAMLGANPSQSIEVDVQLVSGSYYLNYKPHGSFNAYNNVQNVIARLNGKSNTSIMLNAHFDSVPTSPGGSDDGIMCTTMLEILRKLSKKSTRLEHSVIFLFNGAEETPLQASHGFITQHKWAKDVKIMVNLEAAGAGSKEILFQTGPDHPWLINYYENVPHPYGQAAGEEIFQSNIIPSDTDFRIFRDFGNIFGFDFAFARNGYRYHTKYDDFKNIPEGSFQHVGDNILQLVTNLGNAPELHNDVDASNQKIVYFDYLGLFMVSYNLTIAYVINFLVIIASIASSIRAFFTFGFLNNKSKTLICIASVFGNILIGWIAAGLFVLVIAYILDGSHFAMSWYGSPWLVFGLFCIPSIFSMCGVLLLARRFKNFMCNLSINSLCQVQVHCTRILWTLLLFVATVMELRSAYLIMIPILFNTIAFFIIQVLKQEHSVYFWKIIYLLSTIPGTLFLYYLAISVLSLFIPITGRSGSDINMDLLIGILSCGLSILIGTWYIPLIVLVRKSRYILALFLGIFAIHFIFVFTPVGFPYSGNEDSPTPQRHWIHHTSRFIYDKNEKLVEEDYGYFMLNMDRNSPREVSSHVPEIKEGVNIEEEFCKKYILCGLPLLHSRLIDKKLTWIPSKPPVIDEIVDLKLINRINVQDKENVVRLTFELSGPDHMSAFFGLRKGCKLVETSLSNTIPDNYIEWEGRSTYFLKYGWNKEKAPLTFYLDIETPPNYTHTIIDIGASGQNVHVPFEKYTKEYKRFLNAFPEWADLTTGLASVVLKEF